MSHPGDPYGQIVGLFTGRIQTLWAGKEPSAIAKRDVSGPCTVTLDGFEGDMQADLSAHGGPEQALHHYAADHMAHWQSEMPEIADTFAPGCFGENIATTGLDERTLCIGDVLSLGSARVQVSQGRQPCWKLNEHIGRDDMAYRFRKTAKAGWYYRVLEGGTVNVGDFMHVIERPASAWPLHDVIKARFSANLEHDAAQELAKLPFLSPEWRGYFSKKANTA